MRWSLEHLQHRFAAAVDDSAASSSLTDMVTADPVRAQLAQRLALYRGNAASAAETALRHAYPVVRALVGDEFFAALARAYARACPSTSGDLGRFGAQFPSFVSAFEHAQELPYLADVAELEWRLYRAYFAADAEPLGRERIVVLSPNELLAARFTLHPACSWMRSPFPAASIWLAHQDAAQEGFPRALDRGECALIVRPRWHAEVLVSRAGEIAALEALRAGEDIDTAIAAALYAEADFDLARALVRWLDFGVLTSIL